MKKIIYTTLIILLSLQIVAQKQNQINSEVYDFIKKYEMYGGFSSDLGVTKNKSFETEFKKLFINSTDEIIIPSYEVNLPQIKGTKMFYSVGAYSKLVFSKFPNGFDHKVKISIGDPSYVGTNEYWVDVEIVKYIFGLTIKKKMERKESEPIVMKIHNSDIKRGKIKIAKIYDPDKYVDMEGIHIGLFLSPSMASFSTKGFTSEEFLSDKTEWSENGQFNPLNGGIEIVKYSHNPAVNFGLRIMSTTYSVESGLKEYTQSSISLTDIDGDKFMYSFNINGEVLEKVQASFIEIPIFYKYRYELIQNTKINHVYIDIGPSFGFKYKETNSWNAKGTTTGNYFESLKIKEDIKDVPFYGFNSNSELTLAENNKLKGFNLSVFAEAGVNFVLSKPKLSLDIGLIYQKGFTNLSYNDSSYKLSKAPGEFRSTFDSREKVKTSFLGLIFNIKYKLN